MLVGGGRCDKQRVDVARRRASHKKNARRARRRLPVTKIGKRPDHRSGLLRALRARNIVVHDVSSKIEENEENNIVIGTSSKESWALSNLTTNSCFEHKISPCAFVLNTEH